MFMLKGSLRALLSPEKLINYTPFYREHDKYKCAPAHLTVTISSMHSQKTSQI